MTPIANGGTYEFYVVAESKGGIKNAIKVKLILAAQENTEATSVFAAQANEKPSIEGLIDEIKINLIYYKGNDTLQDSTIYEYTSPIASDVEKDPIKIEFSGISGKVFLKVKQDATYPFFTIKIDRSLI